MILRFCSCVTLTVGSGMHPFLYSQPHLLYIVRVLKQQQRHDHRDSRMSHTWTPIQKRMMKIKKNRYLLTVSVRIVLAAVQKSSFISSPKKSFFFWAAAS